MSFELRWGMGVRVGEILVRNRWIDEETLAMETLEQPSTGMRLCSMLARRGLVTFDQASRVLGEQLGVAAVLRHHLNGRDPTVATLIPEAFARERVVLPIGRLDSGALIVCTRDPSPELRAAIARIVGENLVMAVAPATYLERAIEQAFDIDVPIDVEMPVKKRAVPSIASRGGTRDPLDTLLASLSDVDDFGWLLELVLKYLEAHWTAALLLEVRDRRRAVGIAGYGPKLSPKAIRTLILDLEDTHALRRAWDERHVDEPSPMLAGDDALLVAALDTATPVVAPIVVAEEVRYLLVCARAGDREEAVVDLGLLAEALGEAFARLAESR